jgi:glycosyltransferase involved in cell wall biosynthesis
MIAKNKILFLIRSYNEATRIGSVLDAILAAGYPNILVVDDGSRDATPSILAGYKTIHVLRHGLNRGGGAAMETCFEFARRYGEKLDISHIVTFDADGQHDIADMPKFLQAQEKDPTIDVIFGSRFLVLTESNVPFFRRIVLFGGRIFTRMLSRVRLTDSHNGYRMFRLGAIRRIRLTMDGMEYASEIIEEIHQLKLRYVEVPVNIRYDAYSLGKGQRSSNAINIALRMIWRKFFG